MSEYGVAREAESATAAEAEAESVPKADPVGEAEPAGETGPGSESDDDESWFERSETAATIAAAAVDQLEAEPDEQEPVEEYPEADPQQWISGLIADLERAEQGIGSGPRDVLMARIKLAQAYSELGDSAQAAPLAVTNVAQAERLFPSSEGMLRQLREFRDAACEAANWTAAMMRQPDEADELEDGEPSELVARPAAEALAEAWPAVGTDEEELILGGEAEADQPPESTGAVIHEFVRRAPETEAHSWTADAQGNVAPPAELAIPGPPEPEYAEEVAAAVPATDLAAFEEIIRLRYELREAQRTIERLKHVNRKLREALEFEAE